MGHILLVADRKTTIDSLVEILGRRDHTLTVASNQRRALQVVRQLAPDVVIVDTTSAKLSGESICELLRRHTEAPIIGILRDEPSGGGLPFQIDEWLVKPFSAPGLLACIRQVLQKTRVLEVGHLILDLRARTITINGNSPDRLTPKQFALLRYFMSHPGEILTRADLMREIWQTTFLDDTRTLDVHIRWLREKIEADPSMPLHLKTIRGVGYCLQVGASPLQRG